MVTSWLSMEVPMFPAKAVPLRCHWGLDEAPIRRDRAKCLCMRGGRRVTSDGCRHLSLHERDQQDLPSEARTHQPAGGPVGSAGDSSSVIEVDTRVGLILQPRIRPPSRARFLWPGADHGLTAMSAPFANADGIWPRVDALLSCEDRCGRKLWRVINWQFSGDHVVNPGTRI